MTDQLTLASNTPNTHTHVEILSLRYFTLSVVRSFSSYPTSIKPTSPILRFYFSHSSLSPTFSFCLFSSFLLCCFCSSSTCLSAFLTRLFPPSMFNFISINQNSFLLLLCLFVSPRFFILQHVHRTIHLTQIKFRY